MPILCSAMSSSTWLPKKRTPEETVAFAASLLTVLESVAWETAAIEAAMGK